jgi:FkbM family methyltransferase
MNAIQSIFKLVNHPENTGKIFQTIGRVCWWKCNQLFFHMPVIATLLDKTKIICDPNSSYGSYVIYARYPEPVEMSFFEKYLQPQDVVVDVGANIGAWSLIAATKANKGKIYAFEPTKVVETLQQNSVLNNFTNIEIFTEVVSDKNGFEYFSEPSELEISHISTKKKGSKKLKAVTLDTVFSSRKRNHVIDILKVDVEGAELKIFNGAKKLFNTQRLQLVLFEFGKKSAQYGYTFEDIYAFFEKYKFDLYAFTNNKLRRIPSSFAITTTENVVAVRRNSNAYKRIKKFLKR